jgi:hypothetical protein
MKYEVLPVNKIKIKMKLNQDPKTANCNGIKRTITRAKVGIDVAPKQNIEKSVLRGSELKRCISS